MKNKCFDIGMIQAFLDGELASELSERVLKHTAECTDCALMLGEAEEENAFAFAALDGELNVLVPTERLRSKVFSAINEIEKERSIGWWLRISEKFAFFGGIDLRSPSVVALACTILFVGTFAIGLKLLPPMPDEIAVSGPELRIQEIPSRNSAAPNETIANEDSSSTENSDPFIVVRDSRKKRSSRGVRRQRNRTRAKITKLVNRREVQPQPVEVAAVEGEDIYLQTINTLNKSVNESKDFTMRGKERVAFERNIAMVDNAIKKMKAEVKKNPKNKAARELLKSSYQNKINLLSSVSERNELMASMQ